MSKQEDFIAKIGPLIQAEAAKRGYKIASAIIAQACLESAYGGSGLAKYHNYFGLKCGSAWKGKSVNMATKEEYTPGVLTSIKDNFRAYDSMADGVKGYFDFISTARYANLKTAVTAEMYLALIKSDGYATSTKYVQNNMAVVNKYNLTRFDGAAPEIKPTNYFVEITATSLYLRSSYCQESLPLLPKGLPRGMILKITHECNGWGKVGNIDGWICLQYTKKI